MVEKVWLKEYPAGVPEQIDVNEYASVVEILERSCDNFRQRTAYENFGAQINYDELDRLTQDFASYLQNVLGFNKGDRVAVMMPCLLYTSPSPRDGLLARMPSSA